MRTSPFYYILFMVLILNLSAIMAVAQEVSVNDHPPLPPTLTWVDAQSGDLLFSIADIVRFDWDRQLFELTPERASALLSLPITQFLDFTVNDDEGIIYRGRLYRSNSREGYDGSVILIDQGVKQNLPAAPFFTISGGYPGGGGPHDQERFAPRLKAILENAKLLTPIADGELPHTLKWMKSIWVGGDQVLGATPGIYPATVRVGKQAYMHIKFNKGNHPDIKFDKLDVLITCAESDGHFTVTQSLASLLAPPVSNDICVCKFIPWKGSIAPPAPTALNAPAIIKTSQLPRYPKNAVNEHRGGNIVIVLNIGADGKVVSSSILQSSGADDLDKSAMRALRNWTFVAALKDGKSVADTIKIQFEFANEQVQQSVLPPDPIEIIAKPGVMTLTVTFNTLRKTADGYVQTGSWTVPPYELNLLPAE